MISERPTMEQPTNPTRESYGPSTRPHPSSPHMEDDAAILAVAGRHQPANPPLAAAAEGLAMTTAPHGLIGSRRAVGGEASTAVEETPAAAFCRRSPALRLAHQHGGQPPKQRVQGTLGIHGSIDTPRPSACSWALTHRYNICSIYRNSLLLFLVWKDD
uniref:Uncharacterized protein n=1 Tax=Oryza nivara TaxID=4536 RepID=A0A0E0J542_ORYNI